VSWREIQISWKSFSLKWRKISRKRILFSFIATRERLPSGGVWGRLFSHDAPPTSFQPVSVAGDFTQA
jgi:hypothetical protein